MSLGIINDQATSVTATDQATAVTASVQTMPDTTMPATAMPVPFTPTVQSEEDSEYDLPISKYLRKFLQQEEFPQQDFDVPEPQHVTEFSQQDATEIQQHVTEFSQQVSEPHQLPPKKDQILKYNQFRNKNF